VLSGAFLGSYLAKNPESVKQKKFIYGLFTIGLIFVSLFGLLKEVEQHYYGHKEFWSDNTALFFLRVGIVVMLNSVMCFIALKVKSIPVTIKQIGSNTLLVYAVHATILYGSAWIPGFYFYYGKTLNIPMSIVAALLMVFLMISMVSILEKIKLIRRRAIAPVEA
jgi:fucose 4-O-acetylase-like acetyltransferase